MIHGYLDSESVSCYENTRNNFLITADYSGTSKKYYEKK